MRRFSIWAIIAVLALTAIWSALWFYARDYAETQIDQVLAGSQHSSTALYCDERSVGGFPFRLKLACSPARIDLGSGTIAVDLGELMITALAYKPRHVVAEYSAPLIITSSASGQPIQAEWTKGLSSTRISGQSFSIFSTLFENLAITGPQSTFNTTEAQFHARPLADEGVTDLAFSADNAEFGLNGQTSEPFFVAMTLQVNTTPLGVVAGSFTGGNPAIQNIDIRFWYGESQLNATGSLSFSDAGMANGEILLTAKNLKDLAAFLQSLPDQIGTPAQQTVGYLIALGRPGTDDDGEPVSQLTLTVRDSGIYAGDRLIANLGPGS